MASATYDLPPYASMMSPTECAIRSGSSSLRLMSRFGQSPVRLFFAWGQIAPHTLPR